MCNVVVLFTNAKLHFPRIGERNVDQALIQGEPKGVSIHLTTIVEAHLICSNTVFGSCCRIMSCFVRLLNLTRFDGIHIETP